MTDPFPVPAESNPAGPPSAAASDADPIVGSTARGLARRAADETESGQRTSRPSDRLLHLLLLAAERDVRIGLTVTVGGVIVTGTMISSLAYCRAIADQFASTAGGTGMDEMFAEAFSAIVDDMHDVGRGDRRHPADALTYAQAVSFLQLEDARYVNGPMLLPHGRRGTLWRCRVADVSSWSLGDVIAG